MDPGKLCLHKACNEAVIIYEYLINKSNLVLDGVTKYLI